MFSSKVLAEKGKFWNPTLPDITCSRIKITKPKWLILVSFFSGEDSPSTDTNRYSVPVFFGGATLYIYIYIVRTEESVRKDYLYGM